MTSLRREPSLLVALLVVTGLILVFIVYPQTRVIATPGGTGYFDFFTGGTWERPLRNSLTITVLSTTTAVLLGFIYAYAMVYTDMRWKPFFRLVGILPLLSPPFVVAAAYILLFGSRGIVSYHLFGQSLNIPASTGYGAYRRSRSSRSRTSSSPTCSRAAIRDSSRPRATSAQARGASSGP